MKRFILVCAHGDVQLATLIDNQRFFQDAYHAQALRRVRSVHDVRGLAHSEVLYLLPDYERGTEDHRELLAYWQHCRNKVIPLTEDQVRGIAPFEPPTPPAEPALKRTGRHQLEYPTQHHGRTYVDFPAYRGTKS